MHLKQNWSVLKCSQRLGWVSATSLTCASKPLTGLNHLEKATEERRSCRAESTFPNTCEALVPPITLHRETPLLSDCPFYTQLSILFPLRKNITLQSPYPAQHKASEKQLLHRCLWIQKSLVNLVLSISDSGLQQWALKQRESLSISLQAKMNPVSSCSFLHSAVFFI